MDVLMLAREMERAMDPQARCRPGSEAVDAFWDWLVPHYLNGKGKRTRPNKAMREQIATWTEGRSPAAAIPHYRLYVLEDGSILGIPDNGVWFGIPLIPPDEEAPPVPVYRGGLALVCGFGESAEEPTGQDSTPFYGSLHLV